MKEGNIYNITGIYNIISVYCGYNFYFECRKQSLHVIMEVPQV